MHDRLLEILALSDEHALRAQLAELMPCYSPIDFDVGYDRGLWRAHRCRSGTPVFDCGWLWHPQPDVTKHGRLNHAGRPVLYASLHYLGALLEVRAADGEFIHLVNYEINQERKIRCGVVGEVLNVYRTGRSWIDDTLGESINGILKQMPPFEGNSWVYLDGVFASLLTDGNAKHNEYLHSRTLASLLFEARPTIDAIMYPSCAFDGAKNVAIKVDAATTLLKVRRSALVRVNKVYNYGVIDFDEVSVQPVLAVDEG